jgi:flagellar basal body-associated protein FliL
MAQGMNMGIFTLLAVIVSVLAGVAGFFIFLARKSARAAAAQAQASAEIPVTRS